MLRRRDYHGWGGLVAAAAVSASTAACTVAFRSSAGGATAKAGVAKGTSNSIYFGDRGGPLTKVGIGLLGASAGFGSMKVTPSGQKSEEKGIYDPRSGERIGTEIITEEGGTAVVDPDDANKIEDVVDDLDEASDDQRKVVYDPRHDFIALTGGLEIAAKALGGDTSGWMFDFGVRAGRRYGTLGWRASARFAFGQFEFAERDVVAPSDTGEGGIEEDRTYTFIGFPLRLGVTMYGHAELFGQLDLNAVTAMRGLLFGDDRSSPSPWRFGARFDLPRYVYGEVAVAFSSMRDAHRSTMLEAGVEF